MPRHFWISASIALLVAAFALFALALPALSRIDEKALTGQGASEPQVGTYKVPPARAEAIRSALNSVLLANPGRDGVVPLGQASLPAPDRIVVSAPARMQESIRRAITALSDGDAAAPMSKTSVALDVWLVETSAARGADDPSLAPVATVLEQGRQRFGHGQYRLADRLMVVATAGGDSVMATGARLSTSIDVRSSTEGMADTRIDLRVNGASVGAADANTFISRLMLPEGQWQIIGLLPRGNGGSPESLLLIRQMPATAASRGNP